MKRLRKRLSYANVTATLALFVALGGSSYAVTRNSVGAAALRPNSVGKSEIQRYAVRTSEIEDQSIRLRDITLSTRRALTEQGPRGPQGPPGPTFAATVGFSGGLLAGNGTSSEPSANGRIVGFGRSVADCVPTATLTQLPDTPPQQPGAHVTVKPNGDGRVLVETWKPDGTPERYSFNLVVAC